MSFSSCPCIPQGHAVSSPMEMESVPMAIGTPAIPCDCKPRGAARGTNTPLTAPTSLVSEGYGRRMRGDHSLQLLDGPRGHRGHPQRAQAVLDQERRHHERVRFQRQVSALVVKEGRVLDGAVRSAVLQERHCIAVRLLRRRVSVTYTRMWRGKRPWAHVPMPSLPWQWAATALRWRLASAVRFAISSSENCWCAMWSTSDKTPPEQQILMTLAFLRS